jgi:hypothetical protein
MKLPAYWMTRPAPPPGRRTSASFDRLLQQALAKGPGEPIDYRLEAPTWQFLCHAADRGKLLLHGSGDPAIGRFEPRQPDDNSEFGNRRAVFAAGDGLWPMYYAIPASPVSVNPVAKLAVEPEDFPFLDRIRGHDDERVWTRAAADPDGFPWHDEG